MIAVLYIVTVLIVMNGIRIKLCEKYYFQITLKRFISCPKLEVQILPIIQRNNIIPTVCTINYLPNILF